MRAIGFDFDTAVQHAHDVFGTLQLFVEFCDQFQQIRVVAVLRQRSQKHLLCVVHATLHEQTARLPDQRLTFRNTHPRHCRRFTPMDLPVSTTFSTQKPIRFLCNSTSGESAR